MTFKVIIPVRFAAKRFPGKALIDIKGKPMIQHVYERAVESGAENVVVATDDERIKKAVEKFGGQVIMTSSDHPSGTDRLAEAVVVLGYEDDDIVVNVQGDEPLIPPLVIRQVAQNLEKFENAKVATLYEPIKTVEELLNPNNVKVVLNQRGYALYFSRAPIPWERDHFPPNEGDELKAPHFRHVGIYAYWAGFLQTFTEWETSGLEETEQLEQLRVLWNGGRVHVAQAKEKVPIDVNTKEDLTKILEMLK